MHILILETNLMWSSRLRRSAQSLGYTATVVAEISSDLSADVAIVNLATSSAEVVKQLQNMGMYVIGHAGHKEKEKLQFGREAGCDRLATNSELTYKIEALLTEASAARSLQTGEP